jgi:hypothetical protein
MKKLYSWWLPQMRSLFPDRKAVIAGLKAKTAKEKEEGMELAELLAAREALTSAKAANVKLRQDIAATKGKGFIESVAQAIKKLKKGDKKLP